MAFNRDKVFKWHVDQVQKEFRETAHQQECRGDNQVEITHPMRLLTLTTARWGSMDQRSQRPIPDCRDSEH